MNKQSGFTLIELVITIILLSIISAISAKMLSAGLSSYLTATNLITANQQARLALERMTRDIRGIRSTGDITTATAAQLVFTNFAGNSVSYSLTGSNLILNSQTLASGINTLTFTYYDLNGNTTATIANIRYVAISLHVTGNNANYTAGTAVFIGALG